MSMALDRIHDPDSYYFTYSGAVVVSTLVVSCSYMAYPCVGSAVDCASSSFFYLKLINWWRFG